MRSLDSIIVRQASDDFIALKTADAMQSLDSAEVVSIVYQDREPLMYGQPRGVWHVFAKYDSDKITTDCIDAAIDAAIDGDS